MTNEEIIEKTRTTLAGESEIDISVTQPDTPLMKTLGLDSLDSIGVMVLVEKDFGPNITRQDFTGIKTSRNLYNLIITRMREAK